MYTTAIRATSRTIDVVSFGVTPKRAHFVVVEVRDLNNVGEIWSFLLGSLMHAVNTWDEDSTEKGRE